MKLCKEFSLNSILLGLSGMSTLPVVSPVSSGDLMSEKNMQLPGGVSAFLVAILSGPGHINFVGLF